uniref:Uncharacterized protein n=1 Tax=Anguilla anguilla TaxID=7936 RepID=A0A0E9UQJ1_ANGAN
MDTIKSCVSRSG